jgi:hypothetical protein
MKRLIMQFSTISLLDPNILLINVFKNTPTLNFGSLFTNHRAIIH